MLSQNRKSSFRVMKVARRTRPARESGDISLNDVLNYVCRADRRNLRIIENTLAASAAERFGAFGFNDIPIENCEMFILTSNRKEFARLEQAVRDRKRACNLPDGPPDPAKALRRGKKALREFKVRKEVA